MAQDLDPQAVADALGEPLGERVTDGGARLEPFAVPGAADPVAWRVVDESGAHPWQVYVGRSADGDVRVLTGDQPAWDAVIAGAGVALASADEARGYVEAYLEATRGSMVLVRPVASLADLPWRPGSDAQEAAKAALLADAPDLAPSVEDAGDGGFRVELALVVDQRLQRNTFRVARDGRITDTSFRVLAEGLPLPIAR